MYSACLCVFVVLSVTINVHGDLHTRSFPCCATWSRLDSCHLTVVAGGRWRRSCWTWAGYWRGVGQGGAPCGGGGRGCWPPVGWRMAPGAGTRSPWGSPRRGAGCTRSCCCPGRNTAQTRNKKKYRQKQKVLQSFAILILRDKYKICSYISNYS